MAESEAAIDKYYTHPAFTLGDKNLNGIWVGKFETGYKGANSADSAEVNKEDSKSVIIKPDVYAWRKITIKNIFMTSYNYERGLDSHMMKNTEWGVVAYLSHSEYGIGNEVKINNSSDLITGLTITSHFQVDSLNTSTTQSYNSTTGYLASTTGNISGVYDMSGGATEVVAGCLETLDDNELKQYMNLGYIDKYNKNSTETTFNYRILGDATGEMGPFYKYLTVNNASMPLSGWYGDFSYFVTSINTCFHRGGLPNQGNIAGQFYFGGTSDINSNISERSFRITLSI